MCIESAEQYYPGRRRISRSKTKADVDGATCSHIRGSHVHVIYDDWSIPKRGTAKYFSTGKSKSSSYPNGWSWPFGKTSPGRPLDLVLRAWPEKLSDSCPIHIYYPFHAYWIGVVGGSVTTSF